MNRNDLKEYFARLKTGQQNKFSNSSQKSVLQEMDRREQNLAFEDPADMYRNRTSYWQNPANPGRIGGPMENIVADIHDMISNIVGQEDLNFSDEPLTKKDILDFVIENLRQERDIL